MPFRKRHRRRLDRVEAGTIAAGAAVLGTAVTAIVSEARRLRSVSGAGPTPHAPAELLNEAQELVHQAVEETRAGYHALSPADTVRFNLLTSFVASATLARTIAFTLRSRSSVGPFRNLVISDRHIHHFVPGLGLMLGAGACALAADDAGLRQKLAVPFGVGMGLTLDESALLLHLDDVYWRREGLVGFQITFTAMGAMAALPLLRRMRRAGIEAETRS